MRYALIDQLRKRHPVARLCNLLDVAKSGYQAWNTGQAVSPRKRDDVRLLLAIKAAYSVSKWTRIPRQTGQPFHGKLDTDSRANWTVVM